MRYVWRELFQGIVLDRVDFWLPKTHRAVKAAASLKQLRELMEAIHFDGSLIVFFFPDSRKRSCSERQAWRGPKATNACGPRCMP